MLPTFLDLQTALAQGDRANLDSVVLGFGKAAPLLHVVGLLGYKYNWEHTGTLLASLVRAKVAFPSSDVFGEAQILARAADAGFDDALKALKATGDGGATYVASVLDLMGLEKEAATLRRARGVYLLLYAPRAMLDKALGTGA